MSKIAETLAQTEAALDAVKANLDAVTAERDALKAELPTPEEIATLDRIAAKVATMAPPSHPEA